jgi:Rrf2 family protein
MSTALRISEAASLALHSMAYIASSPKRLVTSREIVSALKVSDTHLSKVLQRLVKVGLIKSIRGPNGGFILGKESDSITLLQVYESIDGPLTTANCLLEKPVCNAGSCILGKLLHDVNSEIKAQLSQTKLSHLKNVFRSAYETKDHQN